MIKLKNRSVTIIAFVLYAVSAVVFHQEDQTGLTAKNNAIVVPLIFVFGFYSLKGIYILFFEKISQKEVGEHIEKLKAEGKLPEDFGKDQD